MVTGNPELSSSAIRDEILKIRGVMFAEVVLNDAAEIDEIHIVSGLERGAKQIARDIESLLMARYGIRVDHKAISIAQMDCVPPGESRANEPRLVCDGFGVSVLQNRVQFSVTLSRNDVRVEGFSASGIDAHARSRAMAEATLDAVHKCLSREGLFSVMDVKTITIADSPVQMVCLTDSTAPQGDFLIGTALMRDDQNQSIIRATLSAINRRLKLVEK